MIHHLIPYPWVFSQFVHLDLFLFLLLMVGNIQPFPQVQHLPLEHVLLWLQTFNWTLFQQFLHRFSLYCAFPYQYISKNNRLLFQCSIFLFRWPLLFLCSSLSILWILSCAHSLYIVVTKIYILFLHCLFLYRLLT